MTRTMKAVRYDRYGPPEVLTIEDVPVPEPTPDQVRIDVRAAGVTLSDTYIRSARVQWHLVVPLRLALGIFRPRRKTLGLVYSGVVESVGEQVTRFAPGDEVYGMTGFDFGVFAQYKCLAVTDGARTGCMAIRPAGIRHEEAAVTAYGGLLALQAIDKAAIAPGDHVVLYGGSSTSGTLGIQMVKALGARVTAVAGTDNEGFVQSLGADSYLDYRSQDTPPEGSSFDVFLDCVGRHKTSPLRRALERSLPRGGRNVSIDDGDLLMDSSRLDRIREMVASGAVRPVLDRAYPMAEVLEATRYVEAGHKRGGVALTIPH